MKDFFYKTSICSLILLFLAILVPTYSYGQASGGGSGGQSIISHFGLK